MVYGSVWEQIVLSNLKGHFPYAQFYYYRTSAGAEMDMVLTIRNKVFAVECKASMSPILSKGTYNAIDDINPDYTFVVSPVKKGWPMKKSIDVVSMDELILKIQT